MKLATLKTHLPDGKLVVVSRDLLTAVAVDSIVPTLQMAIEQWSLFAARLEKISDALNQGQAKGAFPFDVKQAAAPLPRAWQWLDGSAFKSHNDLGTRAYKIANSWGERPLMYQGMSHEFLSATDDVPFPSEADGIDFEGEFGVITDSVPAGVNAEQARSHIKLLVQINDWTVRVIGRDEMNRGFGWVRGKPACSVAPVAVTPDEIGPTWKDARIHLALNIWWNGVQFGRASGGEMAFGFDELVAHAAYSRKLCAGTIIGSGTVANADYRNTGSSCIVERRGIEILDYGEPRTGFMKFGDRVRMQAATQTGETPFGVIDQKIIPSKTTS